MHAGQNPALARLWPAFRGKIRGVLFFAVGVFLKTLLNKLQVLNVQILMYLLTVRLGCFARF